MNRKTGKRSIHDSASGETLNEEESKALSAIKVMVIAETQQQRLAFSDTVASLGMSLIDCIAPHEIRDKHINAHADVWLVDSQYDNTLYQRLYPNKAETEDNKTVLVGFNKAPYLNETHFYEKWQRKLKRKLSTMLDLPQLNRRTIYENKTEPWRFVVFLGASMGGPASVKVFLDNLPAHLPVTILLAQHFNHNMIHTLPRILNRHNDWRCQVVAMSQTMQAGQCLIVPVEQKVVCDSTGRVILTDEPWEGEYKPCIGELLKNSSDAFGSDLVGIIFSGMGSDGTQHLAEIQANNSQLWVQEPSSSACASQPQAIIDSGYANLVATPKELAAKLVTYIEQYEH